MNSSTYIKRMNTIRYISIGLLLPSAILVFSSLLLAFENGGYLVLVSAFGLVIHFVLSALALGSTKDVKEEKKRVRRDIEWEEIEDGFSK